MENKYLYTLFVYNLKLFQGEEHYCIQYDSNFIPNIGDFILWNGCEHKVLKRTARVASNSVEIFVINN